MNIAQSRESLGCRIVSTYLEHRKDATVAFLGIVRSGGGVAIISSSVLGYLLSAEQRPGIERAALRAGWTIEAGPAVMHLYGTVDAMFAILLYVCGSAIVATLAGLVRFAQRKTKGGITA